MKLYGYWRSSSSWRVRIALNLKGVAYDQQPVHLIRDGGEQYRPDYLALNPMAQVPALETEHDGDRIVLTQSMAILRYLDHRFPEPPLWPVDPMLQVRACELAEIANSGMQPLHNSSVLQEVERLGSTRQAWCERFLVKGLRAMEARIQASTGRFCVSDAITVADVCLVPQLFPVRRFGLDLSPYPTLSSVEAALLEHPAFVAAAPERQPDAQVT